MTDIPLPPAEFMRLVCGNQTDLVHHFEERGRAIVERLRQHGLLIKGARLLDIGCGCGRVARNLIAEEQITSYLGFDRHPGMIQWCRQHLTSRDKRFDFRYFDLESHYDIEDGYGGTIPTTQFNFPFVENAFSAALGSSVFTHMALSECRHYLEELWRVLEPGGKALVTAFFSSSDGDSQRGHCFYYNRQNFLEQIEQVGFSWCQLENSGAQSAQHWFELTKPD